MTPTGMTTSAANPSLGERRQSGPAHKGDVAGGPLTTVPPTALGLSPRTDPPAGVRHGPAGPVERRPGGPHHAQRPMSLAGHDSRRFNV
jgi:hypothetical protein